MIYRSLVVNADHDFQLIGNVDAQISWINNRFLNAKIENVFGISEGSTQALILFSHDGLKKDG